jgi:hypothetical protein
MATISLAGKHSGSVIVDDDDLPALSVCAWYGVLTRSGLYAYGTPEAGKSPIAMHRFLLGKKPGMVVDHISGDTLDNRRANLRHCRHADNIKNSRKKADTLGRYKGISWSQDRCKWQAEIEVDGDRIYLGRFDHPKDAARQYDRAARLFHGKFARTNEMLGLL